MSSRFPQGRRTFACALLSLGTLTACAADELTAPSAAAVAAAPSASLASNATAAVTPPELPRATVATAPVAPTGRTLRVASGGSLQRAIDSARVGDVILLQAGATFTGNFKLPKKTGTGWVTIRTSTPDGQLPAPGTRVTPSQAPLLAKLRSPNGSAALYTLSGAHHYRLIGLDISAASAVRSATVLVRIGNGSTSSQHALSQVPTHIVLDRSYVHGRSDLDLKNCVELHGANAAVVDSYVSQCHSRLLESHAIIGWNGPGPFLLENNYIEGAGINVMFGGATPAAESLMPSDITIRRNHVTKPLAWKDKWLVKNLFELKIGRRILAEGNVFENNWADGQAGFALLFKTEVGSRANTWGRTEQVTLRGNILRNATAGVNISGRQGSYGLQLRNVRFEHNVFENVGAANGTSNGRMIQVLGAATGVQFEHNTMLHGTTRATMALTLASSSGATRLYFRDNVMTRGSYGVKGDNASEGTSSLQMHAPTSVFTRNALVGGTASRYPAGNLFPATLSAIGFVDASAGDYRLSSSSALKGTASDGTDPGADMAIVRALTAGVKR